MTATELIKTLQDLVAKHGDLPVLANDSEWGPYHASEVEHIRKGELYLNEPAEDSILIN